MRYKLITRNVSTGAEHKNWRTAYRQQIMLWQNAASDYKLTSISHSDFVRSAEIDLLPMVNWISDLANRYKRLVDEKDQSAFQGFGLSPIVVPIQIEPAADAPKTYVGSPSIAEYLFHEIFIILNLCSPGACDFSSAYIVSDPPDLSFFGSERRDEISLGGYFFDNLVDEQRLDSWLSPVILPYEITAAWVRKVAPRFKMVGEGSVSKCLIALLHTVKQHDYGPSALMWIVYALETLFSCRPGENFSSLQRRISAVLELDDVASSQLRKGLRKLYDARSAFVHGGMTVVHPMHDDGLDRENANNLFPLMATIDFGMALLIRCLQTGVINNATRLTFFETAGWE